MFFKGQERPEVTPFGRILPNYSVDELPQLLNVLRGDMSIGARARRCRREVESTTSSSAAGSPSSRPDRPVAGQRPLGSAARGRRPLDLHYVENWSPIQDLVIMAKTVKTVLSTDGAY